MPADWLCVCMTAVLSLEESVRSFLQNSSAQSPENTLTFHNAKLTYQVGGCLSQFLAPSFRGQ